MKKDKLQQRIDRLTGVFPGIMQSFHNLSSEVSRVHELTLAQYRLIQLLHNRKSCTINEIASALGIAQSSASELVTRMVNADLLVREGSESDRRILRIRLSQKAHDILAQRAAAMRQHLHDLLADLNQKQQENFVVAFEKISALLAIQKQNHQGHT